MIQVKECVKYLLYKEKSSSERYLNYLRKAGCKIGEHTYIFASPRDVFIDTTRPFLVEIGSNVQITRNVTILTHGYDWSVLKAKFGDVLGSEGKVKIGNNVFIGMNSTILHCTVIGDNVIIGAGSLVKGRYPDNCVIAGNPAKIICSLEEYYEKRKSKQVEEAKTIAMTYYERYHNKPPRNIFHEYFWLFEERKELLEGKFKNTMKLVENYDQTLKRFMETNPVFKSYEEFIEYCGL